MANSDPIRVEGGAELTALLEGIAPAVRTKVMVKTTRKASTKIKNAAQGMAPAETGLLKLSMYAKVKAYKKGDVVVGITGPRADLVAMFKGRRRRPVKYAHLVEKGHIDAHTGQHIPGRPFLRPAFDTMAESVGAEMEGDMWKAIEREATKR